MKRNIFLIAGFALLLFVMSNSAFAADKIGFVNIPEIIKTSNAGKKAASEFKSLAEKKSAPVKSLENELRKMKDDLDKQGSMMSDSARRDKEAAFQKKTRDYQLMAQDANDELQKRDQDMCQKMMPGILKAVKIIAEKEKCVAIFLVGIPNAPVAYYSKENDITSKVIDEFNKARN
jgi:outer membrane protein